MRILYILSGTNLRGGATKSFLSMADAVGKAGHEIAVVVPDENGITPVLRTRGWKVLVCKYEFCALPKLALTFKDVSFFVPRTVKRVIVNLKAREEIYKFASEFMPDLIHENTSVTDVGHHVAQRLGVPHIIHVREYGWQDFRLVLPGIKRRMASPGTYLITITSALAELRGRGIGHEKLKVIYNGVIDGRDMKYNPHKQPYFLYAGRIESYKGISELIGAYIIYCQKRIADGRRPIGLKLAGMCNDVAYKQHLMAELSKSRVEEYVEWLGEVEEIDTLYANCIATVIPSYREGFGRVMPEATGAGALCIVRNAGGLAEQLTNGLKYAGGDVGLSFSTTAELTCLLEKVSIGYETGCEFTDGGEYHGIIMRAQRTVSDLYTYASNGQQVLEYYNEIMEIKR